MMQKMTLAISVALGALLVTVGGSLLPATAEAQQKFSASVGKPLKVAQEAMAKRRWDEALAKIKEAQAVSTKTPYETYQINELLGYVLLQKGDAAGATRVYEENLNSGQMLADKVADRVRTLAQLNFQLKNFPKAIEYGNRWLKANGSANPDAYQLVAQAYFYQKDRDCKSAIRTIQGGMDAVRRSGKPVSENWLLLKLNCQYELKDDAGVIATREQLVRSFPKEEYWDRLLTMLSNQQDDDERATLNFFRLMLELNVLKKPDDYVEMAQMAIENKVPGEAVAVMNKGFDNKILDNKDKERHLRLLNNAKALAQASQSSLAKLESEARAAKTGDADVTLGAAYLSFGLHDKAVEAIRRGLQKGGIKHVDDAQMLLGRAYLGLKQKEEARKAFESVPQDSKLARVSDLWAIYARQS